jgi:5-hydroxyisourate hydrolase
MAGKLTTHVLDTASGCPAAGVKVSVYRDGKLIGSAVTSSDGRLDKPAIGESELSRGNYRLEFAVGDYFASRGHADARRFLDVVPVAFVVDDPGRDYHVPLLVSPWSYSTYRGS